MFKFVTCVLFVTLFSFSISSQTVSPPQVPAAQPSPPPPSIRNDTSPAGTARRPPVLNDGTTTPPQTGSTPAKKSPFDPNEDEVIKIETNLVTTPVSVLDRNGRFIAGLRKKDFKIYEDGVLQKLDYFQSVEQPFTVVLMIDVSPSTRYHIDDIHYAAVTFVNQLRPNDKVVVVAFDQRFRILCEPTTDKQVLYSAIYKAQFGSGTSLYDAVDQVVRGELRNLPGRKAVVLFTDGVDTTSRRSDYQSTIAAVEEVDALFYPIRYDTQQRPDATRSGTPGAPNNVDALIAAALSNRLPAGARIRVGGGQSDIEYERGRAYLETLAQNSGGRKFEANVEQNLEAAFAGVAEELRRQYSIGYHSNGSGQAGDRKKIKVEVARPNAVVRSKTSYIVTEAK